MKRILIFYSHFFPAFKAGGPIQSLRNMVEMIGDDFVIDVVCGAYDLGEKHVLKGVIPDAWNPLQRNVNVLYVKTGIVEKVRATFRQRKPDIVYINGIFLPYYSWLPLIIARRRNIPVVFSPRGMLQKGALAKGLMKKMFSIWILRFFNFTNDIVWHATDEQEESDIRRCFYANSVVRVIGNVPRSPHPFNQKIDKVIGKIRLVYLSLISEKKNLAYVLKILKRIRTPIVFDIYGPAKDQNYWNECLELIPGQIHSINYFGPVYPEMVQETLKKYHAFILLTKGENFGHAIYEALSAGVPAIISQYTPWGSLHSVKAGITVNIEHEQECVAALEEFAALDQGAFDELSKGAFELARKYYETHQFKDMYTSLFNDR